MLEKQIERAVKDYAESKGWITRKWTSPGHAFVPDQIFISPRGKVIFVEFKQLGKKPTAGQEREHQRLRQNMVSVFVTDSVQSGREMVDHYDGEN
jgi:hypothetical protein